MRKNATVRLTKKRLGRQPAVKLTSSLESKFAFYWKALAQDVPEPPTLVREYRFDPKRRWRFDFALPAKRVAFEMEGGIWSGGRHTRGAGFIADCEKYNTATLAGWRIIRVTAQAITGENVAAWIAWTTQLPLLPDAHG